MKKTKSAFEAERRAAWRGRVYGEGSIGNKVREDVEAAEAAGVTWEPEAPEWPELIAAPFTIDWILMRDSAGHRDPVPEETAERIARAWIPPSEAGPSRRRGVGRYWSPYRTFPATSATAV